MRNALERTTGRDCDLITEEDLASVRTLSVSPADDLNRRDFAGLDNLGHLVLSGYEISPDIFADLDNLRTLELDTTIVSIKRLSAETVGHMSMLEGVHWRGNNLSLNSPGGVFAGMENVQSLDLSQPDRFNPRSTVPTVPIVPGVFEGLTNLQVLTLGKTERVTECADSCWYWCSCSRYVQEDWLTEDLLDDLINLRTLQVCDSQDAPQLSTDTVDLLADRGVALLTMTATSGRNSPECVP